MTSTRPPATLWLPVGATLAALVTLAGCATAPPAAPARFTYQQKMAWILQLEDQRLLRLPPPPPPAEPPRRGRVQPPAVQPADLALLVRDAEPRLRRRAALAVGRVGLIAGAPLLTPLLQDPDPDVRQMAAFGLGLLGDTSAAPALIELLGDDALMVRGRAAEALGLMSATLAAEPIARLAGAYARGGVLSPLAPDQETGVPPEAEVFRLAVGALVRLKAYDALAGAVLDANGRPLSTWWPVAYALQRVEDPRAAPALLQLLQGPGRYTRAFAARGLGTAKHGPAAAPLSKVLLAEDTPDEVAVAAMRALAQIGGDGSGDAILRRLQRPGTPPNLLLEGVAALGALGAEAGWELLLDLLTDSWPALRAAALRAAAAMDPEGLLFVLAGLPADRHWLVRAAMAEILPQLPEAVAEQRLREMLDDEDKRVIPAVLGGLVRIRAAGVDAILLERLEDPDFVVRTAAARHLGELKAPGAAEALRAAYRRGLPDAAYGARAAALEALHALSPEEARETLREALADGNWAVRIRAAQLLSQQDDAEEIAAAIRPAPSGTVAAYDDQQLISPEFSPRAYIDTARGTIEISLAVLDAPQTSWNFTTLARRGFFNGLAIHRVVPNFVVQDGDPRGDGQGGPGYTIRDELNDRPYLRGTVGMALSWPDTAGSQFFITHSPQPHLEGRYTVFGQVVEGMEVVDRLQHGDVIQRIRVWDGKSWE